jgi:phosphate transport system protein
MGKVARLISDKVGGVINSKDIDKALEVEKDDDEMDLLHRRLFTALLEPSWPHGIETAIDMTLIGRYYERYADHAVSVSRRIHFQVTGKYNNES